MTQTIHTIGIADIQPDARNANRGTERGATMLEQSLRSYGAGRSILIDRNNRVIAGNKTLEQAAGIGLDAVEVVDSDGTKLIAVRRTDIDLDTPQGRELAIADNRTAEVGLEWDIEALRELEQEGVDLGTFWSSAELDVLLTDVPSSEEWGNAMGTLPKGDKPPFQQMTFTLSDEQAQEVKRALEIAHAQGPFVDTGNENGNGNALHRICAAYEERHGDR